MNREISANHGNRIENCERQLEDSRTQISIANGMLTETTQDASTGERKQNQNSTSRR